MGLGITTDLIDGVDDAVAALVTGWAPTLPGLAYADVRLEVTQAKAAGAENGEPKFASDDYTCAIGVRVLAGDRMVGAGHLGRALGAADLPHLEEVVKDAIGHAHRRARANGEAKARTRAAFPGLGQSLIDTRLAPVAPARDRVPAVYRVDPRSIALGDMMRETLDVARAVRALDPRVSYSYLGTHTELARELFCSSEGAKIDQTFALTQGMAYIVVATAETSQELYDVVGAQRGWEALTEGAREALVDMPTFRAFALGLAGEGLALVAAPPLPSTSEPVVVVTDPHYNALVAHEVIGHPTELDRGLKMETAYAGRSWLLRTLDDTWVGRQVASPLVSAYSDPALPGYGHYRYDHEGTPGRRVVHVDRGVLGGFTNSRQTAAIFGAEPNGHYKAAEAALVPLIRMSNTVLAAGTDDPGQIVRDVEHGYYLAAHRIPSIAESRENFRISARRVYEIRNGELGQLYRDGGLMADTRDYFMQVDAVGTDLRLHPIPNCGKGQPMQTKRLGNGGPTMRSRARLAGGR